MTGAAPVGHPHVVMVPGLGLQPAAWQPTRNALQESRPRLSIETLTLPGYGAPARRKEPLDVGTVGRLIAGSVAGHPGVVLFGHSSSCQVVADAAARCGASVAGVVLVGPTTDPRAATWPRLARRWLATARHEPPWQVPMLVRHYSRTGLVTMARTMDAARRHDVRDSLAQVTCPVLLVRGVEDRIAPPDWLSELVSVTGSATRPPERIDLSAGGHMVPLTHGRLVADAALALLDDVAAE